MRRLILQEFLSLDSLAAGIDESVDFIPAATAGDQSFGDRQIRFLDSIDTILLGRVTYEMFSQYWPNVTTGDDKPFADKLNAIPKVVFSETLREAPWGKWPSAQVASNAMVEVAKLKRRAGKDMVVWGSLSLAQSFIRENVIDEYQLIVCPVVLGRGRPLFDESDASLDLKLLRTQSFDHGSVLLSYAPAID